ncbi:hypothetical protein IQ265_08915 [Nodosilinea sp. LEGE 06152]|uniref:hypothetical protein n=1 Tax=Nodosilinea sp. LEGE 06152 TaxID=2777966 RepID=UPI001882D459|nr:hypothetical protein [Nodosilinea sp. LEGE 06152]MBE9156947.1 hypothetical protein [Nodosilinea sp. LEGE 06152]
MPKTFLYTSAPSEDEATPSTAGERDKVRVLVIGRPTAVNRVILEMSHLGFSDSIEWSKPIPTDRQQESMRVLTRYVFSDS